MLCLHSVCCQVHPGLMSSAKFTEEEIVFPPFVPNRLMSFKIVYVMLLKNLSKCCLYLIQRVLSFWKIMKFAHLPQKRHSSICFWKCCLFCALTTKSFLCFLHLDNACLDRCLTKICTVMWWGLLRIRSGGTGQQQSRILFIFNRCVLLFR